MSRLFASDHVRRAQVGKPIKKIVVWPNVISRHLPVGEDSKEDTGIVVGERAAVVREGPGTEGLRKRYPTDGSVTIYSGLAGLSSIFLRSLLTYTRKESVSLLYSAPQADRKSVT